MSTDVYTPKTQYWGYSWLTPMLKLGKTKRSKDGYSSLDFIDQDKGHFENKRIQDLRHPIPTLSTLDAPSSFRICEDINLLDSPNILCTSPQAFALTESSSGQMVHYHRC